MSSNPPDDDARSSTSLSYDRIVEDYERRTASVSSAYARFRESFVASVGTSGRIADLGCGPGRDASYFALRGLAVVGLDASPEMARRAATTSIPLTVGDIRALPFGSGVFDGLWSSASLLHVPRPDVLATLISWRRCLRAHGVLGLSTSLGSDEGWEVAPYQAATQPRDVPLRRWFVHHERQELLDLLGAAGYRVVSTEERVSHRRWLQLLARREPAG